MKNKRGDGYILPCVMILILSMLITALMSFWGAVNLVRNTERNARIVLDNYVMENAIVIYDSIKQGNNVTDYLDNSAYLENFCWYCTLDNDGSFLYNYDTEGVMQYGMTPPVLSFREEGRLKLCASYTMFVPIYFAGMTVGIAEVPITVESELDDKF